MLKKLVAALFLLSVTVVSASPTTPCTTASLASYQSTFLYPSTLGCSIGILDYSNFTYHAISNAPSASTILLTPTSQGFGFTQTNGLPFTAVGQVVTFEIDYNILIDPSPILTGADDSIDPTGNVSVTEYFCNDSQYFFSATCFGGTGIQTLKVGTIPPLTLSNSITFNTPATSFQEVGILFTLDGTTNGPASFTGLDTDTTVIGISPEPAGTFLVGLGLIAGSYTLRKRKR